MHISDLAIAIALLLAVVLGVRSGLRMTTPRLTVVRAVLITALLVFTAALIVACIMVRTGASDLLRLIIFWIIVACLLPSAFGLGAAAAMYRQAGYRRSARILALLSLSPIPLFALVATFRMVLIGSP